MSNRGGSRNRGSGSWREDDNWGDDRYAPPPPRRQGSSRGSAQGASRAPRPRYDQDDDHRAAPSRSRRANAWEDDDRWGDTAAADGMTGADQRTGTIRATPENDAAASLLDCQGWARMAALGELSPAKRRGVSIRGLLVALVVVAILGGLGYGAYTLLRSQGSAARPTAIVPDAAFATYTPGPTPTPATNFKEFASARAKYVLSYPNTWAVSSNEAKLQQQYDYTEASDPPNSPSHVSVEQAGSSRTTPSRRSSRARSRSAAERLHLHRSHHRAGEADSGRRDMGAARIRHQRQRAAAAHGDSGDPPRW